jgi:hypothetical protein
MTKFFNNSVKVFFYDELANQNSKTITNVNDGNEEHWKSKHKLST